MVKYMDSGLKPKKTGPIEGPVAEMAAKDGYFLALAIS